MSFMVRNFFSAYKLISTSPRKYAFRSIHASKKFEFDYKDTMRKVEILVPRKRLIPGIIVVAGGSVLLLGINLGAYIYRTNPVIYVDEIVDGKKVRKKIREIYQEMPPPNIESNERLYSQDTFDKITSNQNITKEEIIKEGKKQKITKEAPFIPKQAQYLLIGGGPASFSAARTIRTNDPMSQILIVTEEDEYPYMRPPLSKELWFEKDNNLVNNLIYKSWQGKDKSVYFEDVSFYGKLEDMGSDMRGGIYVLKGHKVIKLDTEKSSVHLEDGQTIGFEKCLIATGGRPKRLPKDIKIDSPALIDEKILYFRNIHDFKTLNNKLQGIDEKIKQPKSIAILGGGFLGTELACGIAQRYGADKVKVTQLIREPGVLYKILPAYLSKWATQLLQQDGVNVIPNVKVTGLTLSAKDKRTDQPKMVINTAEGPQVEVDHLLVAIGLEPCTELARLSGFDIEEGETQSQSHGILVDPDLKLAPNIWAAGDVVTIRDPVDGKIRCDHHDHAISTGTSAGFGMTTGSGKGFAHQSMFWSDIGSQLGLEGVGLVDSTLDTLAVFANQSDPVKDVQADHSLSSQEGLTKKTSDDPTKKYGKGVIFYMKDDVVVGILAINLFGQLSIARKIIKTRLKNPDVNQLSKLFDLYEEFPEAATIAPDGDKLPS